MGAYTSPLTGSGILAPTTLVEVLTKSGSLYAWSEQIGTWTSMLQGSTIRYLDWLAAPAQFRFFGSTQTDTATIVVQNISGNTVTRDAATIFTKDELIGALVFCRVLRGDSEEALLSFQGNVVNVEPDETTMTLSLESFGNWSAVPAPTYNIDVTCPLSFGSTACGSTSPTPCDQTYGTCSQIHRFAGVIIQWDRTPVQATIS